MVSHTFYRVVEKTYSDASGAAYTVEPVTYCTNDNGEGIFDESCINQIVGNGQFCGGRSEVRKYFDDPKSTDSRVLDTETGANRVAATLRKLHPVKKFPVRQHTVGSKVVFLGDDCTVLSQNGRDVEIAYDGVPGYTTTVKDYEIY